MSLDVYLSYDRPPTEPVKQAIFIRRDGANVEITRQEWDDLNPGVEPVTATVNASNEREEVFSRNITHNLGKMAGLAGLYAHLWRPDEVGVTKAAQLIDVLDAGLTKLRADPDTFRRHNPANGWGTYEGLVMFVSDYLKACREHPDADVRAWR